MVPFPANGYETLLQQAHTQPFAAPQNDGYESTQRSYPSERNTIPEHPMGATPLSSTRLSTSSPVWPSSIKFTDSGSVSSCRLPSTGYLNDEFLVSENLSNFVGGSLCQLENSISRSASTYEELRETPSILWTPRCLPNLSIENCPKASPRISPTPALPRSPRGQFLTPSQKSHLSHAITALGQHVPQVSAVQQIETDILLPSMGVL